MLNMETTLLRAGVAFVGSVRVDWRLFDHYGGESWSLVAVVTGGERSPEAAVEAVSEALDWPVGRSYSHPGGPFRGDAWAWTRRRDPAVYVRQLGGLDI